MINNIALKGVLADEIHAVRTDTDGLTWHGTVSIVRESGTADYLPVVMAERCLQKVSPADLQGKRVTAYGEIRTYTDAEAEAGSRHRVVVWITSIREDTQTHDKQHVTLTGAICKKPINRLTPGGREICELMIANNFPGGANYIPVICWGHTARKMASANVSDIVLVEGRFQSRQYEKKLDTVKDADVNAMSVWRTAYEVSANCCWVMGSGRRANAES